MVSIHSCFGCRTICIHIDLCLFFAGFGFLLVPQLTKFKIGVFEIERVEKEIKEVKEILIRGKVIRDEYEKLYYINIEGFLLLIPDQLTADFLKGTEGIISISRDEINQRFGLYRGGDLESVKEGKLVIAGPKGHVFIILNGKKHYVSSWAYIIDWGREPVEVDLDELRKIPSGNR